MQDGAEQSRKVLAARATTLYVFKDFSKTLPTRFHARSCARTVCSNPVLPQGTSEGSSSWYGRTRVATRFGKVHLTTSSGRHWLSSHCHTQRFAFWASSVYTNMGCLDRQGGKWPSQGSRGEIYAQVAACTYTTLRSSCNRSQARGSCRTCLQIIPSWSRLSQASLRCALKQAAVSRKAFAASKSRSLYMHACMCYISSAVRGWVYVWRTTFVHTGCRLAITLSCQSDRSSTVSGKVCAGTTYSTPSRSRALDHLRMTSWILSIANYKWSKGRVQFDLNCHDMNPVTYMQQY